jgi:hypothetical protein
MRRTLALVLVPCLLIVTGGCMATNSFLSSSSEPQPATDVCKVVAAWNPEVVFTPDPTKRGKPTPGIAGRMYLFGPGMDVPRVGDGCVVVELFQGSALALDKDPPILEEWRIDKDTFRRLLHKDAVGWGYTLFLPWGTYRPEITQVQLRLRYEPVNAAPLYADEAKLAFSRQTVPLHEVASASSQPSQTVASAKGSANTPAATLGLPLLPAAAPWVQRTSATTPQ